jgi:hypothetical protein
MIKPVHGQFHRNAPKVADVHETRSERVMAWITAKVGTLACAIVFTVIAAMGAPAKFAEGTKGIVEWLAQQFLQLVLLAIILGGQRVTEKATDAQTRHISAGIDTALGALDLAKEGGLTQARDEILAAINKETADA